MRLTIRFLGLDLLDVDWSTDSAYEDVDDTARDLSGGSLGSGWIEAGETDHFMGFTAGMSSDDRT